MTVKKRKAVRQKSLLRGFGYFGGSTAAIDCIVRDLSDTGARLAFSVSPPADDVIEFHIPSKGWVLHAKAIWRKADEVGVSFVRSSVPEWAEPQDGTLTERIARLEFELGKVKQLVRRLQRTADSKINAA
jgi:PilZ domain